MAPLFVGLRVGGAGREGDVDFYVESVRDLWHADRPLSDAAERVRVLERFPELQPTDDAVVTDVVGINTFFAALVLRYALLANRSGSAAEAVSCGHVALTAMGMLDQHMGGAAYLAQEHGLQSLSVSGDAAGLWEASTEAGRERFRAVLGRAPAAWAAGTTP
ncbi:hypothetical protein AB0O67_01375 [Streptomyces sp. NPDC086077]|uniref:hypothetical protein n=1 Tax=Streptomyces sp. NPDC086077 TaxID=3154862 RepID=UPI003417106B